MLEYQDQFLSFQYDKKNCQVKESIREGRGACEVKSQISWVLWEWELSLIYEIQRSLISNQVHRLRRNPPGTREKHSQNKA